MRNTEQKYLKTKENSNEIQPVIYEYSRHGNLVHVYRTTHAFRYYSRFSRVISRIRTSSPPSQISRQIRSGRTARNDVVFCGLAWCSPSLCRVVFRETHRRIYLRSFAEREMYLFSERGRVEGGGEGVFALA